MQQRLVRSNALVHSGLEALKEQVPGLGLQLLVELVLPLNLALRVDGVHIVDSLRGKHRLARQEKVEDHARREHI